jgi:hypothetical protein
MCYIERVSATGADHVATGAKLEREVKPRSMCSAHSMLTLPSISEVFATGVDYRLLVLSWNQR